MSTFRSFLMLPAMVAVMLTVACGAPAAAPTVPPDAEPAIIEWSIGTKGGLGEGSAIITQHSWEPKKLNVPLNQPFIIRFVPRDSDTSDTIIFGNSLKSEVGIELENLVVTGGQPAETPVMVIRSSNKSFDVFSREHRSVGGFGSLVTPAS